MTTPLQIYSVMGSYINYAPQSATNPTPNSNGSAGSSVVVNFSQNMTTPFSDIDLSDISVTWTVTSASPTTSATQNPTSASWIAPNLLQLNFSTPFETSSYLNATQNPGNGSISVTVQPSALPDDTSKFPYTGTSASPAYQAISRRNDTPTSPAPIPGYMAFTISSDLNNYLTAIGSSSISEAVYLSVPDGGALYWWPGLATGVPGQTSANFPFAQTQSSGSAIGIGANIPLADLNQTIPAGGTFSYYSSAANATYSSSYGLLQPVQAPNMGINASANGAIYISMATPASPNGGQIVYPADDLGTAPAFTGDASNNNLIWQKALEPYAGVQPGWNSSQTDINNDITYVDSYQFPLSMQVYGANGEALTGTQGNFQNFVDGGAGTSSTPGKGDQIYATLTNQSLYGELQNQVYGYGRVVAPTHAVDPANQLSIGYHNWDAYFNYLADTNNTPTAILSGGTPLNPQQQTDGALTFSYTAKFFNASGNKYVLLESVLAQDSGNTYEAIYIPYSSGSVIPTGTTPATYMNQGGGIYGASSSVYVISNLTQSQLTALENVTSASDFNGLSVAYEAALGNTAEQKFASGDVLSGFNFGLLGSTVQYSIGDATSKNIGDLSSFEWWAANGPVANGVWGPWAQWNNVGLTNTQTTNAYWNTYQFALNGSIANNIAYYQDQTNLGNSALANAPLTPYVYAFAFSDRLSNSKPVQVEFNGPGGDPAAQDNPQPMPYGLAGTAQTGYLNVTIGAPTVLTPLFPQIVQGSLNNSQWDTQVWWSGSTNNYQMLYTTSSGGRASESAQISLPSGYTYTGAGKLIGAAAESQAIWKNDSIGIQYARTSDNGQTFSLTPIAKPAGDSWQYWTSADTTGDGVNELLWVYQDQYVGVTLLDAQGNKSSDNWYSGLAGTWTPVAAADFNNDGRADILWRDGSLQSSTYGAIATSITGSSGISQTSQNWLGFAGQGLDWQYYGVGDFNGDGVTDTVWTAPTTALDGSKQEAMSVMLTNASGTGSTGSYWFSSPGEGWYLQGIADFNNDAYADTYWWNDSLNGGATFLTNNPDSWSTGAAPNAQGIWWGSPGTGWEFSSISNIDSNNYADVMFVNSKGQLAAQIGSASGAFQSNQFLGVTDTGWGVTPNQPL